MDPQIADFPAPEYQGSWRTILRAVPNLPIDPVLLTLFALLAVVGRSAGVRGGAGRRRRLREGRVPPLVGVGDNNSRCSPINELQGARQQDFAPHHALRLLPGPASSLPPWMLGCRRAGNAGVDPLISFEHSYRLPDEAPDGRRVRRVAQLPALRAPRASTVSPWNEANHKSQPTVDNNPKRAAQYFNITADDLLLTARSSRQTCSTRRT